MDATHFMTIADPGRSGPLAVHGTAIADAALAPEEAPEWVMLIPAGEFSGRDGRGPFRLASPAQVIAATRALGLAAGLPIDYDHATDFAAPKGRPAPAAGWIRDFAERDGALWGRVAWTPHGARAITSREYRYLSPVFQYASDGTVIRLLRAGLTNNPNLYLTAISARALAPRSDAAADGLAEGDGAMDTLLEQLREMLGLNDDAAPAEVLAAVRALGEDARRFSRDDGGGDDDDDDDEDDGVRGEQRLESRPQDAGATGAGGDPARFVAVAQFQRVLGELNQLRAEHARERAERAVEDAIRSGKLIPAQREWAISYCQADEKGFAAFVARQPVAFGPSHEDAAAAFASAPAPSAGSAAAALTAAESAVCAQLGLNPRDYLARKRSGRSDFPQPGRGSD